MFHSFETLDNYLPFEFEQTSDGFTMKAETIIPGDADSNVSIEEPAAITMAMDQARRTVSSILEKHDKDRITTRADNGDNHNATTMGRRARTRARRATTRYE